MADTRQTKENIKYRLRTNPPATKSPNNLPTKPFRQLLCSQRRPAPRATGCFQAQEGASRQGWRDIKGEAKVGGRSLYSHTSFCKVPPPQASQAPRRVEDKTRATSTRIITDKPPSVLSNNRVSGVVVTNRGTSYGFYQAIELAHRVEQFEAFWKEIGGAVSQYDGAKWHAENPLFNRWAPPPIPDVPVTRGYEYDRKATRFLQGFSSDFVLAKSLENRVGFDRGTLCFECFFGEIPCLRVAHGNTQLPTKCNFCRANTASCVPVPFPASFVVTDRGKAQLNEKWQAFQLNEWIEDSACTSSGGLPETLLSVIIGWIQRNSGDAAAQAARARVYSANAVSPVPQGNSNAVASSSSTGDLPPFPEAALLRFAPDTHDGNPTVDGDGDVNMYGGEEQTGNGGGRKISVDYGKGKGSAVDEEDFFEEDHAGHGDEYSFDPASPIRVANPIPRPSPPPRTGSSSSLADALGRPCPRPLVNAPHSAPNPAPAPGPSGTPAPPSVYLAAPRPQSFGERARSFATGSISVGPSVPNSIYGPNFSGPPRSGGGEGSSGGAALPPWRRIGGGEETDVFGGASSRTASSSGNFGNGDQRVEHGTTGDLPSSADGPYGHPPTAHMPNDNPGTSNS
ncbi:hypothetical protein DFH06DRAFT_1304662 [Mycena polygramma]|nr:hypothetical protein DFH06DRAFT_1304662 [Mycena polygramma]